MTFSDAMLATMLVFMAISLLWSVRWALRGRGYWRFVHAATSFFMLVSGWAYALHVLADRSVPTAGMLAGFGVILTSIAVLTGQKARWRWLAVVQLVFGVIFASGAPFVTA